MAESGLEAEKKEQEESVQAGLEKLAQEELGETAEVESLYFLAPLGALIGLDF